jgi:hypothetical protein
MPAGAAFAAMIAVTAFNGYMAWIQDSELLALYAIAGGLSTPLLVSTGGNHEVTLFTYLLMLDLAVLVLVALRPWSRLLFVSFVGTAIFVFAWWFRFIRRTRLGDGDSSLLLLPDPFSLAPRLVQARSVNAEGCHGWDSLVRRGGAACRWPMRRWAFWLLLPDLSRDGSIGRRRGWRWHLPRTICC